MKRKRRLILFTIIAIGLLAIIAGVLEGASANTIPQAYLPYAWLALAIVALLTIGFLFWQYRLQEDDEKVLQSIQNRRRMIEKVRAFWIKGVLEQSLHNVALIALGLHEKPDAVADPWHLVLQTSAQERPLPAGTRITQVYDASGGELLILGEPGSGKTTLLLELACDLLDRAEKDKVLQIPVVFNLSSWSLKPRPLSDWLILELKTKYQVPHKLAKTWVDGDQILLLLDGLDEVKLESREQCIKVINAYRDDHGIVPIIVCSRTTEYLSQENRILMRTAIVVQPLTENQVDDYLSSAGEQLATVRVALRQDVILQELVATPLMLSILMLAYKRVSIEEILADSSPDKRRKHVFENYVESMLSRRGVVTRYTTKQITYWLSWLAQNMAQYAETEFYLEQMQKHWLPDSRSGSFYLITSMIFWLVFILAVGLVLGLAIELPNGPVAALFFIPIAVLVFVLICGDRVEVFEEAITWSGHRVWKNLFFVLVLGLVFVSTTWLLDGLVGGLVGGLISVLIGGLSIKKLDAQKLVSPIQRMWKAPRNGLFFGLIFGLITGLVAGVFFGLFFWLAFGLAFGLVMGLVVGLIYGGDILIEHLTMRFLFWRAGYMPWNYPRFLDYAADRILLRKVGGGYIFVHRLLLEYFASLDTTAIDNGNAKQKQQTTT